MNANAIPDIPRLRNNLTGKRFGRLVVMAYSHRQVYEKNWINAWRCKCDCGNECVRVQRALLQGGLSSCGCARTDIQQKRRNYGCGSFNGLRTAYRIGARNRNLIFELSDDEFRTLTSGDCFYCGIAPSQIITNGKCKPYVYNGIDRINNSLGYKIENCRSCCGQCNTAKNTLTETEFYQWARRVWDRISVAPSPTGSTR